MVKYVYILEQADDGSYSAHLPDLPGCVSCGDTLDELHRNIREAVGAHVALMRENGEAVPEPTSTAGMVEAA